MTNVARCWAIPDIFVSCILVRPWHNHQTGGFNWKKPMEAGGITMNAWEGHLLPNAGPVTGFVPRYNCSDDMPTHIVLQSVVQNQNFRRTRGRGLLESTAILTA